MLSGRLTKNLIFLDIFFSTCSKKLDLAKHQRSKSDCLFYDSFSGINFAWSDCVFDPYDRDMPKNLSDFLVSRIHEVF